MPNELDMKMQAVTMQTAKVLPVFEGTLSRREHYGFEGSSLENYVNNAKYRVVAMLGAFVIK